MNHYDILLTYLTKQFLFVKPKFLSLMKIIIRIINFLKWLYFYIRIVYIVFRNVFVKIWNWVFDVLLFCCVWVLNYIASRLTLIPWRYQSAVLSTIIWWIKYFGKTFKWKWYIWYTTKSESEYNIFLGWVDYALSSLTETACLSVHKSVFVCMLNLVGVNIVLYLFFSSRIPNFYWRFIFWCVWLLWCCWIFFGFAACYCWVIDFILTFFGGFIDMFRGRDTKWLTLRDFAHLYRD